MRCFIIFTLCVFPYFSFSQFYALELGGKTSEGILVFEDIHYEDVMLSPNVKNFEPDMYREGLYKCYFEPADKDETQTLWIYVNHDLPAGFIVIQGQEDISLDFYAVTHTIQMNYMPSDEVTPSLPYEEGRSFCFTSQAFSLQLSDLTEGSKLVCPVLEIKVLDGELYVKEALSYDDVRAPEGDPPTYQQATTGTSILGTVTSWLNVFDSYIDGFFIEEQ